MTLRQALQLLADDGLVDTRHGSGTFVASRYAYHLGHLRSFAADLAGQGAAISTRLLTADTIAPPEPVGARLGLGPASQVLRLRRLRLADGRPVEREPVNIHAVLDRVRALAANGVADGLILKDAYDPSLPPTVGDGDQLVQIFLNLVKNAAEAAHARGDGRPSCSSDCDLLTHAPADKSRPLHDDDARRGDPVLGP